MLVFMCSQDLRLYNEVFMSVYFLFNFFLSTFKLPNVSQCCLTLGIYLEILENNANHGERSLKWVASGVMIMGK